MNKFRLTINVLAIAIFTFAFASVAQAQATRTWVSGVGDDANPCSRTAPCKTFAGAISKTATLGEINALDNGGFGALTITKSIAIEGGGQIAGVLVSGTAGIIINAPTDALVTVRNVEFNGLGTGTFGVRILAAKNVVIDNCHIYGFRNTGGGINGRGISDERTTGSPAHLLVNNSLIKDNIAGVAIAPTAGTSTVKANIHNTRIEANSLGVFGSSSAIITVTSSRISGNLGDGLQITSSAQANIISSVITNNGTIGANNAGGTQLSLADVSIMNNTTGVAGTITSFGNNNVRNNTGGNTLAAGVGQQ